MNLKCLFCCLEQVMGGTCGKWLQWFTLALTVFNLMGNGTAQIVAGAANTYFINPVLTKRCAFPPLAILRMNGIVCLKTLYILWLCA